MEPYGAGFSGRYSPRRAGGQEKEGKEKEETKTHSHQKKLKERTTIIAPELGLRVGYLYPVLLGEVRNGEADSSGGYSIEAYYSHPITFFGFSANDLYLPEIYAFTALESYPIDFTGGRNNITIPAAYTRVILAFGLLYAYRFGQVHSLKGGLALGGGLESNAANGISSSSLFFSPNVLLGYGFIHRNINFSFFSRTSLTPGENFNTLGFGLSLGAGYLLD